MANRKLVRKQPLRSRGQQSEAKLSEKQGQHWERGEEAKMKEEGRNHGMIALATEKEAIEFFSSV